MSEDKAYTKTSKINSNLTCIKVSISITTNDVNHESFGYWNCVTDHTWIRIAKTSTTDCRPQMEIVIYPGRMGRFTYQQKEEW
jgi:hypothetical protein